MIGVAIDITERRQAERQSRRLLDELAHMGRISTMGEMASGLAHELNQPLAAIVAYVDACQELLESCRSQTAYNWLKSCDRCRVRQSGQAKSSTVSER